HQHGARRANLIQEDREMKIMSQIRQRMKEAETRRKTRDLSDHLRRDIGLPEREQLPRFDRF
ncbi:MAG: DUF1127 domain-containing protein, partial [Pseudomonadota bacterium]